jgi:hypothetical protein
MSLQVIIPTCDKYVWLMPGFFQQWNEYCGLPGMVVCEQVAPKVPAGWSHFRTGHDTPSKGWCGNLIMALEQVHSEVVLLALDDYWLNKPADITQIIALTEWMESDFTIDKIDLTNDRLGFAHADWDNNFVRSLPHAQYLTSTQAALWRTAYLKRCLANPAWNPWQFEIEGTQLVQQYHHKILGCRVPAIHYANIMLKGQINPREIAKISQDDNRRLATIGAFQNRGDK